VSSFLFESFSLTNSLPIRRNSTAERLMIPRVPRSSPADYGWLFCAVTVDGYVWSGGGLGAEHSSGNLEDIEVPIAFFGSGIPARRVERAASTVDIAPTLAALIGVKPLETLDGRVLPEVK
jgi:hypothetical protein